MDVMNKLRMDSLKRLIVPILLLILLGIGFLNRSNLFVKRPVPQNLSEVSAEEMNGAYVTTNVDRIYACYASVEMMSGMRPTGIILQRSYVIRANGNQYIALVLSGSMMEKGQALLAESDDYYYGNIPEITADFPVTGYLQPLVGAHLKKFQDAFNYDALSAAERSNIRPYYLSPWEVPLHILPLVIGILLILAGVVLLGLCLSGWFQRQIRDKKRELNLAPEQLETISNNLWKKWNFSSKAVFHEKFMLLRCGTSHYLLDESDIQCAYLQYIPLNGPGKFTRYIPGYLPTNFSNPHIALELSDGSKKRIYFKSMENCEILLQVIWGKYPNSYQEEA